MMQWKILGGLRFFLAFIVVCDHLHSFIAENEEPWNSFYKLGGFAAVLGFLLVSGYSIAHSITQKPQGFYKRRLLRIYPLYICAVIFSLTPFFILGSKISVLHGEYIQPDLWTIGGNLLLTQGFLVKFLGSNPPIWTLSIECICYLLAPLFVKFSDRKLLILIFSSGLLFGLFPYYYNRIALLESAKIGGYHYAFIPYGIGFILLLWAWLLGFFYFRHQEKTSSKILLITLGCFLLEQNSVVTSRWVITTYLISSAILIYSPYIKLPNKLLNFLNYLGEISYPLYLFHVPTLIISYSLLGIRNSVQLVCLALFISILVYQVIDKPFRSKRHLSHLGLQGTRNAKAKST